MSEIKAWPFEEARLILKKIGNKLPEKGYVLFETGYGPSGLPHIGTFGEVVRTSMVRKAFELISDMKTRLFAFSDDLDGLRKVPDNISNSEMVKNHIGKPLTSIPDPYGTHESYAHNMNARLCAFLDQFGFEYEFKSATECYKSGLFDHHLLAILQNYDKVMKVMLPTLGEERQQTYSPFLPICRKTGKVLQIPVEIYDDESISFIDEEGEKIITKVTGGNCKLQWKPDWGMRWAALGVDYEMHGKDLIPSADLSSKICHIIGSEPPVRFNYELFLDENGQKISKSKGNGLTMDDWLRYAPPESLSLYMFQSPKRAKKLYFDVIPKAVDEYIAFVQKYQNDDKESPAWHIHGGNIPELGILVSFSLLLNLASACNPEDKSVLWGFISRYNANANPDNSPFLDRLVDNAINYYEDFVKPHKSFRAPTELEAMAMQQLAEELAKLDRGAKAEEIQNLVYAVGKDSGIEELRDWFQALYQVLLGQNQGPRFGSFIELYGIDNSVNMIKKTL